MVPLLPLINVWKKHNTTSHIHTYQPRPSSVDCHETRTCWTVSLEFLLASLLKRTVAVPLLSYSMMIAHILGKKNKNLHLFMQHARCKRTLRFCLNCPHFWNNVLQVKPVLNGLVMTTATTIDQSWKCQFFMTAVTILSQAEYSSCHSSNIKALKHDAIADCGQCPKFLSRLSHSYTLLF